MPSTIVMATPPGCGPGTSNRATSPTMRPNRIHARINIERSPSWSYVEQRGCQRSSAPPLVVDDDFPDERDGAARGEQEEHDGEPRIAEEAERRLHPHEQRRADDQRGEKQAERDPVRDLLERGDELRLVDGV